MKKARIFFFVIVLATELCAAQARRKVIINEDCSGPGGSNCRRCW
jgi:hypothetical protein